MSNGHNPKITYQLIATTLGLILLGGAFFGSAQIAFADDDKDKKKTQKDKLKKLKDLIKKFKDKKADDDNKDKKKNLKDKIKKFKELIKITKKNPRCRLIITSLTDWWYRLQTPISWPLPPM